MNDNIDTFNKTSAIYAYRSNPSLTDFPGRTSAILFTPGCNFRCPFCHNAQLINNKLHKFSMEKLQEVIDNFKKMWVECVTITGGEPTIHPELPDTLRLLKDNNLKIKLDTNAYNYDMIIECLKYVDYVAVDIKCSPEKYGRISGRRDASRRVFNTAKAIAKSQVEHEFRTTVVPTIHDEEEIRKCASFAKLADKYILQPFVPRENLLDPSLESVPRPTNEYLHKLAEIVKKIAPETQICVRGDDF